MIGLKEHFTSEMLGLDIGNPELFNRHASSEHMVKVGIATSCFPVVIVSYYITRQRFVQDYTPTYCAVSAMKGVTSGDEC